MFIGNLEIEEVEAWEPGENLVTLKNGNEVYLTDKNKELFTETASTGSDLQMRQSTMAVKDIIDVLHAHNVRLIDVGLIFQLATDTIHAKNDETLVNAMGRQKLETVSEIFGATEKADGNTVRNIRIKDIFTS